MEESEGSLAQRIFDLFINFKLSFSGDFEIDSADSERLKDDICRMLNVIHGRMILIKAFSKLIDTKLLPLLEIPTRKVMDEIKALGIATMEVTLVVLDGCSQTQKARELWKDFKPKGPSGVRVLKKEIIVYDDSEFHWSDLHSIHRDLTQVPAIIKEIKGNEFFYPTERKVFTGKVLEVTTDVGSFEILIPKETLNPVVSDWLAEPWTE